MTLIFVYMGGRVLDTGCLEIHVATEDMKLHIRIIIIIMLLLLSLLLFIYLSCCPPYNYIF